MTHLVGRGDDVDADNLLSEDGFRVDAVQSGSKFCVLGQGLDRRKKIGEMTHTVVKSV